jgi:predicted porin
LEVQKYGRSFIQKSYFTRHLNMKTKLLAGLIGACFAAPVLAQSSITIYGIADAGLHITNNGEGTRTRLVSGIAEGSRIGFKGVEDIGDGFKAIFNIEARVELDTGSNTTGNLGRNENFIFTEGLTFAPVFTAQATAAAIAAGQTPAAAAAIGAASAAAYIASPTGIADVNARTAAAIAAPAAGLLAGTRLGVRTAASGSLVNPNRNIFDRTASVGLITPVGAIILGRQYTPAYEVLAASDAFEVGTAGSWGSVAFGTGGFITTGIAIRSDQSVQYRIVHPSGFSLALMYGFKNSGYLGLDKRFYSGHIKYKANGFDLGIGYANGQDQIGNSGLISTVAGGSYEVDSFKFFAGYLNMRNENSVVVPLILAQVWDAAIAPTLAAQPVALRTALRGTFEANLRQNFKLNADSYTGGVQFKLNSGKITASVSYTNDKLATDSDPTQYALGYNHFLSKRTDLYLIGAYIDNSKLGQYASGAASAPGGYTLNRGGNSRTVQIGMRHKF